MKNKLYEAIDVWKRVSEKQLVRYRCFRILLLNKFCVQSADGYYLPFDEKLNRQHDKQFLELLLENAPDKREKTYSTLEEAIEAFEKDFQEEFGNIEESLAKERVYK